MVQNIYRQVGLDIHVLILALIHNIYKKKEMFLDERDFRVFATNYDWR
jgi:hypothetical protein